MAVYPIPNDWNGEDWCCWAVEWPNSVQWNAILRGFITTPMRGRFWDGRTGSITGAQLIGNEIYLRNEPLEVSIMSCNSDVAAALQAIAAALQGQGCCGGSVPGVNGGSGGAGMIPGEPSPHSSTPTDREGPPPPGYESWDEFDQLACNMAMYIIDQIIVDIGTSAIVNVALTDVAGLAALIVPLLTTPIGWAIVLTIAGLMIENLILAVAYADIITWFTDNKSELVCALLLGTDVDSSINSVVDKVDEIIDAENGFGGGLGEYWARRYIKAWFTVDSVNRLYNRQGINPPDQDCPCGGEAIFEIYNPGGEGQGAYGALSKSGSHYTLTLEDVGGGNWRGNAHVIKSGTELGRCLRLSNITSTPSHTGNQDYFLSCGSVTPGLCPTGVVTGLEGECVHALILAANSAGIVEFDVEDCE